MTNPIETTTGNAILRARIWAGLTQVELASEIKVGQSFLASLETGKLPPNASTMWKIMMACRCEWRMTERGYVFIPGE